jgi:hypothetical protein
MKKPPYGFTIKQKGMLRHPRKLPPRGDDGKVMTGFGTLQSEKYVHERACERMRYWEYFDLDNLLDKRTKR